jgi:ADP-ribosylglycohydrolase
MTLPPNYAERVYAGVLGKIIGVYLGRPFEGWPKEKIEKELGEIHYYVHDKVGVPLIVTDDDITGTFTFLRALPDHGNDPDITPAEIGHTWLNYIIENKSILWWGGMGRSTEHTAFLRLKNGVEAPLSGSCELNSKVVSEQIGAQIFIDGWAMVVPNDPAKAVDLAKRAGSVSHDGEAIYGAQVLAAMESAAFGEADLEKLFDIGVSFVPQDSVIYRMIAELRSLRKTEENWRKAFKWLRKNYGYECYGGGCHMVPNHGLMMLSLLWGDDDFQKTMMIVNTCGWDTDCNAGNVGCLMGIKNGLTGLDQGPDWRGPVADRLYLPTADGGSAISDAVIETDRIVNIGRALQGLKAELPKNGAKFHFSYPGSVQGFNSDTGSISNVNGKLKLQGHGLRALTPTFLPPDALTMPGYDLTACPTLYPGQIIKASLIAESDVQCRLVIESYAEDGITLVPHYGKTVSLKAGESHELSWKLDANKHHPIVKVGIELIDNTDEDLLFLDSLTWEGVPEYSLIPFWKYGMDSTPLLRPWVKANDWDFNFWFDGNLNMVQNEGTGMVLQGTRDWTDYTVTANLEAHFCQSFGLAMHVQGLNRYYALMLERPGKAKLVKSLDKPTVLEETDFEWNLDQSYTFKLYQANGIVHAFIDDTPLFAVEETDQLLSNGAVGVLVEEGRILIKSVIVGN